jgi:hypothetical protein
MLLRAISLSIGLIFCVAASQAQSSYKPLIKEGYYWDIGVIGPSICRYTEFPKRYFFDGDTVINSITYNKLAYYLMPNATFGFNSQPCPPFACDTIKHAVTYVFLREDTLSQKVYRYDWGGEALFYDFTLTKGDSMHFPAWDGVVDTVYYITTLDNVSRKVIQFMGWNGSGSTMGFPDATMIEGIGSNNGLFVEPTPFFEEGGEVMCFLPFAGSKIYPSGGNSCAEFITTIREKANRIMIYPNPVKDVLYFTEPLMLAEFTVYNTVGELVYSKHISNANEVDLAFLPAGSYHAKIAKDHSVQMISVIKL